MVSIHFLRPAWFLALLPLAALLLLVWRQRLASRSWQAVVDPGLLPHLLIDGGGRPRRWPLAALALGALLAVTALAGPTWEKLQQPVFRRDSALVVLLDLSRSMDAADLQPSRLQLARFKLRDLLARRKEGDTALIVYAADPFAVTPLTGDTATIDRQLPSLTTALMPAQGSRADRAIAEAQALLQQAGAAHGDVLLITDGVENTPPAELHKAVSALRGAGYRLSVLGVGTPDGAPIPQPGGGFFQDDAGAIVLARLDEAALKRLAADGGGLYRRLASNDSDTDAFTATFAAGPLDLGAEQVAGMKADQWREEGPWLLLPLLPLAALAFRRGYLLALLLVLLVPTPRSAYALDWQGLWQSPDQRGAAALAAKEPKQAADLFTDPQWRAAARYRAGDYAKALDDLKDLPGADAAYNRGNALAQLGKFPEALAAYDQALKQAPEMADARHNRELVQKWLQQQKQQQKSGDQGQQQPDDRSQGKQGDKPQADRQRQPGKSDQQQAQDSQQDQGQGQPQEGQQHQKDAEAKPQQDPSQQADAGKDKQEKKPSDQAAAPAQPAKAEEKQKPDQNATAADDAKPPSESQQATEQWLRRIPDDPGGLWRRKFLYQYQRQYQAQQGEAKPW